ncbi:toll/interleukin-1 receptor domain-containing protein [bacterium]|nr:toll/interleukin-1 receptor domain-containing protein [bacterium]MBU1959086.1 toll/interleukin-1 receptor domain-containing protein [bacterium]
MALFDYKQLKEMEMQIPKNKSYDYLWKRAINEVTIDSIKEDSFDIFLSHSYNDKKIIPVLKYLFEQMGYTVYVDWITDELLSRDEVDKKTAEVLQKRMKQSKCLIYSTSDNSKNSRWMPWELGYFDGIRTKMVGILPIRIDENFKDDFKGEEYLGLYYYISIDKLSRDLEHTVMAMEKSALEQMRQNMSKVDKLFINENSSKFILFKEWINGGTPYTLEDEYEKIMEEHKKE